MSSWKCYKSMSECRNMFNEVSWALTFSSRVWCQSDHAEKGVCVVCQISAGNKSPDWKGSNSLDEVKRLAVWGHFSQRRTDRLSESVELKIFMAGLYTDDVLLTYFRIHFRTMIISQYNIWSLMCLFWL